MRNSASHAEHNRMFSMNHTSEPNTLCDSDPNAITIEQANAAIAAGLPSLNGNETLSPSDARGRHLSADLLSPMASPPFRASAMDGFAIRLADPGDTRRIVGNSYAGHPGPNTLEIGDCVRVMTGAKVPDDADTVVQIENTEESKDHITLMTRPTQLGHHVRNIGSDCEDGSCIAKAGTRINAGLIGLCAALGINELQVKRTVKIQVLSSGDELAPKGSQLGDGQIYDSNGDLLAALLDNPNFDVTIAEPMQDTFDGIDQSLTAAKDAGADVIITTGGVSVGERDHLRTVIDSRGGVDLWKVAMKPGRPLSFGLLDGDTPWFGLPGNPVSAALTALIFVIPAIRHAQGLAAKPFRVLPARCESMLKKLPGRVEFQRGVLTISDAGEWSVSTTGLHEVIPYEFFEGSIA